MLMLVVSDLHLGKGEFLQSGHVNLMEDFYDDEMFREMLEYYSTDKYENETVHLILNGDILNLLAIDIDGVFTHIIDENVSKRAVDIIARGHKLFFSSIRNFLKTKNKKVTYVIGNHDIGMLFPLAQEEFCRHIDCTIPFVESLNHKGIHIEHGHRFDPLNCVPRFKQIVKGPNGKMILNLPWGSLFCILVLPQLKKDRPNIDKVRPLSKYAKWCFYYDFSFFIKAIRLIFNSVLRLTGRKDFQHSKGFWGTVKLLRQFAIYPKYAKLTRQLMKRKKYIRTMIIGHTHIREWRRFPDGKFYLNSGTWNIIPSFDVGQQADEKKLTYLYLNVNDLSNELLDVSINSWQGQWKPFRSDGCLTSLI